MPKFRISYCAQATVWAEETIEAADADAARELGFARLESDCKAKRESDALFWEFQDGIPEFPEVNEVQQVE